VTKKRRTGARLAVSVGALVLLAGGAWYGHWVFVQHRLRVVAPGRLYQSAAMPLDDLVCVARKHDIRTVIDLRLGSEGDIEGERNALAKLGVRYVHLPSPQVPDAETVDSFLGIAGRTENLPILVHCAHGEGRSVLFAALFRIEFEHWQNERARTACRLFSERGTFGPDGDKGQYLLGYSPHLSSVDR